MLTLISSRYVFRSTSGIGTSYCIEVSVDAGGRATVVSVRSERGGSTMDSCGCPSQIPEEVAGDVALAVDAALALWRRDAVGTVDVLFQGDESVPVVFPWGPLGTDTYLCLVTAADGTTVKAVDRTKTGLVLLASAPLGSMANPVKVSVTVYVPAYVASPLTFTIFFSDKDDPVRKIPLPKPINPDAYHVLVDPVGLFPAALLLKARDHFEIEVGALPPPGEIHHVRYLVTIP